MNFSEALKAMKIGSKVSREAWRGEISFWEIKDDKLFSQFPNGSYQEEKAVNFYNILAEDWWLVT